MLKRICQAVTVLAMLAAMLYAPELWLFFGPQCGTDTECETLYGVEP